MEQGTAGAPDSKGLSGCGWCEPVAWALPTLVDVGLFFYDSSLGHPAALLKGMSAFPLARIQTFSWGSHR